MKDKKWADNKEVNRAKDPNLQGGPDIDTTEQDKPAGLEREHGEMIGHDRGEWGSHVLSEEVLIEQDDVDPSGDDPFVPNTPEISGGVGPEAGLDRQQLKVERMQHKDPKGEKGPEYEKDQGKTDSPPGGTSDPHDDLTHDSSGLVDEEWKKRVDVDKSYGGQ